MATSRERKLFDRLVFLVRGIISKYVKDSGAYLSHMREVNKIVDAFEREVGSEPTDDI